MSAIICVRDGVALVGAIERDGGDVVFTFEKKCRVHVETSFLRFRALHHCDERRVGVCRADFVGHRENFVEARGIDAGIGARFLQRGDDLLGRDVAD